MFQHHPSELTEDYQDVLNIRLYLQKALTLEAISPSGLFAVLPDYTTLQTKRNIKVVDILKRFPLTMLERSCILIV